MNWNFPHPSRRMPVFARQAVSTSQPLAAQVGLDILRRGGNAVDAAIATAATLTVVEPNNNGLGSDAFAILWDGKELRGLNSSGRSPAGWTPERFSGREAMPLLGWDAVTVPGCVAAWAELSHEYGRMPFAELLEGAIHYATEGFPVSPITAAAWEKGLETRRVYTDFVGHFSLDGRAPKPGEVFRSPDTARSLKLIAESRGEAFYKGELARAIARDSREKGGAMTEADLSAHRPEWVNPISRDFNGYTLHEIPPNGQGIAALIAIGILEKIGAANEEPDSPVAWHLQIEAMKLALADVYQYIGEPEGGFRWEALLEDVYLARRARLIDRNKALPATHGSPLESDTVYLTAADSDGMMVSFIQSNFWGFGSGVVVPGTGISMQNRGHGFSLMPGHPNQVAPRKRPFHTIIPGFVTKGGAPVMSFGVMGGSMQAQGHTQMMMRLYGWGENVQAALDASRWRVEGAEVLIEERTPDHIISDLTARGHKLRTGTHFTEFGGGQMIHRVGDGVYACGSDPRKDGCAVGF